MLPPLPAGLEEELQPHADAKERPVSRDVSEDRFHQPAGMQLPHRVTESTDTGEDDPLRLRDPLGIVGDQRQSADPFKRLLHTAEVSTAVVDDRQHGRSL